MIVQPRNFPYHLGISRIFAYLLGAISSRIKCLSPSAHPPQNLAHFWQKRRFFKNDACLFYRFGFTVPLFSITVSNLFWRLSPSDSVCCWLWSLKVAPFRLAALGLNSVNFKKHDKRWVDLFARYPTENSAFFSAAYPNTASFFLEEHNGQSKWAKQSMNRLCKYSIEYIHSCWTPTVCIVCKL